MIRELRDSVRLSFGLLSTVPVRPIAPTARTAGAAMLLAPVVGLVLGAVAAGVLAMSRLPVDAAGSGTRLLPAVLAITTLALLTRGMHLDGLADTADGLASMLPPAQARAVMRRGDVGPAGVTAVVLVLLLQVSALSVAVIAGRATTALLAATMGGRLAATLACAQRHVETGDAGLGDSVAGTVRRGSALVLTALVLWGSAVLGVLDGDGTATVEAVRAAGGVLAGLFVAGVLQRHAVRRLGGVTGDGLGALVEVATTITLVAVAL